MQRPATHEASIPKDLDAKDLDAKGRMARQLRKKKGQKIDARRQTIVEPVFGQIKEGRGLRRFLLRGLEEGNQPRQAPWRG